MIAQHESGGDAILDADGLIFMLKTRDSAAKPRLIYPAGATAASQRRYRKESARFDDEPLAPIVTFTLLSIYQRATQRLPPSAVIRYAPPIVPVSRKRAAPSFFTPRREKRATVHFAILCLRVMALPRGPSISAD